MTDPQINELLDKINTLAGEYASAFIFAAVVPDPTGEEGDTQTIFRQRGSRAGVIGLCETLKTDLLSQHHDTPLSLEGDEE